MKLILVVIAVLCGLAAIFEFDTGTLSAAQVLGLGVIAAAVAHVAP